MTTYGTIQTFSSSSPANLEYISRAKQRIKEGLGTRRPWNEMFNFDALNRPANFSDGVSRIRTNVAYFQTNYAIVLLSVIFLSLLWHPISLIVFIVLMAAWLLLYFLREDEPLVIFGRVINDQVVLIGLSVVTLVLLLSTNATSNIMSSLAVGVVLALIHGALRKTDDLFLDKETAGDFPSGGSAPSS